MVVWIAILAVPKSLPTVMAHLEMHPPPQAMMRTGIPPAAQGLPLIAINYHNTSNECPVTVNSLVLEPI